MVSYFLRHLTNASVSHLHKSALRVSMKVMHIITGLQAGGAEMSLFKLCTATDDRIQHVVVSLMDRGIYGDPLSAAGVQVYELGISPSIPKIMPFLKLLDIIRHEKPEVVQTWMYHADLVGGLAAKLVGVKNIFWGIRHSTLQLGKTGLGTFCVAGLCAALSYFVPKKIITCARRAVSVHTALGYAKSKFILIPNGYDLSIFKPDQKLRSEIRKSFSIEDNVFLFGSVGRFDPYKDHSNLLHALVQLKPKNLNYKCILIGEGMSWDNTILKNQIESLGLLDNVLLAGFRKDINAMMNALDCHVLASSSEAFPNVLAEAMASGTYCITTDVGDASYILSNEECVCPPKDPLAMADLMIDAYELWAWDQPKWKCRQKEFVFRVRDTFSIGNMVESFVEVWNNSKTQ